MRPYYDDGTVTIYHADCREILPSLAADVLVTDPPYGIDFRSGWTGSNIAGDTDTTLRDDILVAWGGRPAIVFGAAGEAKLADSVATLVWHRPGSGMGDLTLPWKPDFELIHIFGAGFAAPTRGPGVLRDVFRGAALHPHQKPLGLMRDLVSKCPPGVVVDPFAGSGSTLVAARDLGRRVIGVEVAEHYCEVAVRRLAQGVMDFEAAA